MNAEKLAEETLWQIAILRAESRLLTGHPKAKIAYGWHHLDGADDQDEKFVTVLGLPPVVSPETAVKAAVATEIRQMRKAAEAREPK